MSKLAPVGAGHCGLLHLSQPFSPLLSCVQGVLEIQTGDRDLRRGARDQRCLRSLSALAAFAVIWMEGPWPEMRARLVGDGDLAPPLLAYPTYLGPESLSSLPLNYTTSPPIRSIRHAMKRWPVRVHAIPTP